MSGLVYFSSRSGNTARFVDRLGLPASRIPIAPDAPMPKPRAPFVLITPSYSDGAGRGAVHKQVIRFLNDPDTRHHLRGVIGAGNRNFGAMFALAADVVARKCGVPVLYRFELAGTDTDIARVTEGLERFWNREFSTAI